jgi:L-threonylcarbamoyladenylate synthase
VSPTRAEHVRRDLGDDVDIVLDGGACEVGVESTILDLTREAPLLLRPGGVTVERIESLLGVTVDRRPPPDARAPGLLESHYAPRATVELVAPSALRARARELTASGRRVAALITTEGEQAELEDSAGVTLLDLRGGAERAAQGLYAALRDADAAQADVVLAALPAASGFGEALTDRLTKAAGPRSTGRVGAEE